jgi:hypothetical protein
MSWRSLTYKQFHRHFVNSTRILQILVFTSLVCERLLLKTNHNKSFIHPQVLHLLEQGERV